MRVGPEVEVGDVAVIDAREAFTSIHDAAEKRDAILCRTCGARLWADASGTTGPRGAEARPGLLDRPAPGQRLEAGVAAHEGTRGASRDPGHGCEVFRPGEVIAVEGLLGRLICAQERGALRSSQLEAAAGGKVQGTGRPSRRYSECEGPAPGVVPLFGIMANGWSAGEFATDVVSSRRLVADHVNSANVDALLLVIDSPGGGVTGIEELHGSLMAARSRKPVLAAVVGQASSAAYWIASAADHISVTPSGQVGSIGVFAVHADVSGALDKAGVKVTIISSTPQKTEGSEFQPLSADARAKIQADVNGYHSRFVADVAAGRGVAPATVEQRFGRGRTLLARDAKAAGMVDAIATLESAITSAGNLTGHAYVSARELSPLGGARTQKRAPQARRVSDVEAAQRKLKALSLEVL